MTACASASAAEYFVAPSGSDHASGESLAAAWQTIRRGVKSLKPGDTLTIAAGVYEEQVVVTVSGAPQKPITIRARRPGFSIIKASRRIEGFQRVPGTRFVSAAKAPYKIYSVMEADTHRMLLRAPGAIDLDQFRNAYYYDEAAKRLYVHCSDGLPAASHCVEGTVRHGYGMVLRKAKYVHVEGLVLQGHSIDKRSGHGFGLSMQGTQNCIIRSCTFLNNAGGATFNGGCTNDVVRDCLFIGNNDPLYGELAQLYFSGGTKGAKAINNIVLNAETHGIRFYNWATDSTAIGNIVKRARIGLYFKATRGTRTARNNVVVDCSYFNFAAGGSPGPIEVRHNTVATPSYTRLGHSNEPPASGQTNLIFDAAAVDPKFCDPVHLDYRLQADSTFRGKGPNGTDLGAYPFEGNVFFVSPKGDDARDGLCVARAWKTLQHACPQVRPGDTVYLLPGRYEATLRPAKSGAAGKPIVFRGRGDSGDVEIAPRAGAVACDLTGREFITLEDVCFIGGARAGVGSANGDGAITFKRCAILSSSGPALRASGASMIHIDRCLLVSEKGPAAEIANARDATITSTALLSNGASALALERARPDALFLEYNDYFVRGASAPLITRDGKPYTSLDAWQKASRLDAFSLNADPRIKNMLRGTLEGNSPLVGRGQFGQHIGPGGVVGASMKPTIQDVRLRQITPTTASFTWWTPQTSSALWRSTAGWWTPPPELSKIRYGPTPKLGKEVVSYGDVYSRVTLFDLEPGTRYYFQVELVREGVKTDVAEFRTPAVGAWQPKRRKLYVSPEGSDDNDGLSAQTAWRTIAMASEEARAGDTLIVADGVYQETFAPVATGVQGAPIVLMSRNLNAAVFDGSNRHRPSAVALHHKAHIIVDGFVFRFFAHKVLGCRAGYDYAQIVLWGSRNIVIQNCFQFGPYGYGHAAFVKWSRDVTWRNNVMMTFAGAIYALKCQGIRLFSNTFYDPRGLNLSIQDAAQKFVVKNNLFYGETGKRWYHMFICPRTKDVDYNAFAFRAGAKYRYIGGGPTHVAPADGSGAGLAGWRKKGINDAHSIEPKPEDAKFSHAPTSDRGGPAYRKFWSAYGFGKKVPTLALFDLPTDSPLSAAGEHGAPIGARPRRAPLPK